MQPTNPQKLSTNNHLDGGVSASNQAVATPLYKVSSQDAWRDVFKEPFDLKNTVGSFDVLVESLTEPVLDDQSRPIDRAAKAGSGERMAFISKVFEKAVALRRMESFPEGSLGKMALVAGNSQACVTASRCRCSFRQ